MHVDVGRHIDSPHLRPIQAVADDMLLGNDAGLDDVLAVVNILEESIQCAHALATAARQHVPRAWPQNPWNDVEWDGTLYACFVAVNRKSDAMAGIQGVG